MKKLLLTALLVFASTAGFAQKMKVQLDKESGTITVNEVPQAILIKENAPGQLGINKNFAITNLDGRRLWSADAGNIPPLPHNTNSLVILEATWRNGERTRQRCFTNQW